MSLFFICLKLSHIKEVEDNEFTQAMELFV